jgi:hypothetical protein
MPTLTHEQWFLVAFGLVLFATFWMAVAALSRPTVAVGSGSYPFGTEEVRPINSNIESSADAEDLGVFRSLTSHDENLKRTDRFFQGLPYEAGSGDILPPDNIIFPGNSIYETLKRIPRILTHLPYEAGADSGTGWGAAHPSSDGGCHTWPNCDETLPSKGSITQ